jgi:endonuclease YncB( thermonuclease family)
VACIALLLPGIAWADTLGGRVVNVHDGDTVTVFDSENTQRKIRRAGIDAPELGQTFGRASRDLARLDLVDASPLRAQPASEP